MKGSFVFQLLILLVILILSRSLLIIYLNYKSLSHASLEKPGLIVNIIIFILVIYLLKNFSFSNKILVILLYIVLVRPLLDFLIYLQKAYNIFNLNQNDISKLNKIELVASNFSSILSLFVSTYIIYYLFTNKK